MKTKVYKVDIANDKAFREIMRIQGIKFMPNSVLKNCICGYNYYWVQDSYYGLLLESLTYKYEVIEF